MTNKVPEYFQNKELRLILFGGKGGVGKTTMAAAAALHLAQTYRNEKNVLVISTDPAHSLGDSFGIELGDEVTSVVSGQGAVTSNEQHPPKSPLEGGLRGVLTSNNQQSMTNDQCPMTNLYARELDAVKLGNEFKQRNGAVIKKLADRGTYFDRQDITEFFNLSLPGMDEVMAIIEIADILREGIYDVLILDTAPTGHTVRMLSLPEQMLKWIEFMDLMQQKHRFMAVHFTGKKYVKDECDLFIDKLTSDIKRVKKLLSNEQTTRFVPVTIPEPMATSETKRLLSALKRNNIPVTDIIVNRVADAHECAFCASKQEDQRQPLSEIQESFSQYGLIKVSLFPNEIRGVEGLKGLADYLMGISRPHELPKAVVSVEETQACLALDPNLEFVLFGGKGGVGKTSLASAAALHLARCNPDKNILIFCTDPAHSLSDSFKLTIGDKITQIDWSQHPPKSPLKGGLGGVSPIEGGLGGVSPIEGGLGGVSPIEGGLRGVLTSNEQPAMTNDQCPMTNDPARLASESVAGRQSPMTNDQCPVTNLFALEINADKLFEDFKQDFKQEIEEIFDKFLGGGVDIKFDREVMTELLTLAPPGLDEIMALDKIMDLRKEGKFDIFVLDTSPTGHLLRFLELPDMVREWLNAFFRLLLKYKGVVRMAKAAEKALAMSKNVRRIQEAFMDRNRTNFVAITIPEAMGLLELERLVSALDNAKIHCGNIIVNMVNTPLSPPSKGDTPLSPPSKGDTPLSPPSKGDLGGCCNFCLSKRVEQTGYIKKIHSIFPSRTITKVPMFPHEVRGIDDLHKIGEIIFCNGEF